MREGNAREPPCSHQEQALQRPLREHVAALEKKTARGVGSMGTTAPPMETGARRLFFYILKDRGLLTSSGFVRQHWTRHG